MIFMRPVLKMQTSRIYPLHCSSREVAPFRTSNSRVQCTVNKGRQDGGHGQLKLNLITKSLHQQRVTACYPLLFRREEGENCMTGC